MEDNSQIDYVFWLWVEREIAPIVTFFVSDSTDLSSCANKLEHWLRQAVHPHEQVVLFRTEKKANDPLTAIPDPSEKEATCLAELERDEMIAFVKRPISEKENL